MRSCHHVVRAEEHPDVVGLNQVGNRRETRIVEFGQRRFRPQQEVGFIGERLLRQRDQLLEAVGVLARIPDHGLRDGGLHERDAQGFVRERRVADARVPVTKRSSTSASGRMISASQT